MRRKIWAILLIYLGILLAGGMVITVRHHQKSEDAGGRVSAEETLESGGDGGESPQSGEEGRANSSAEDRETEQGENADGSETSGGETAQGNSAKDRQDRPGKKPQGALSGGSRTESEEEVPEEEPYVYPTIAWASDLHFMSPAMTDYGQKFQDTVAADDGKIIGYTPQLVDALIDEVIELNPSALVLGGDVTFNGEKQCHIDLAEKLRRVQEAGIQVLMIPGNHDLNNPNAASYAGDTKTAAESVDAAGFYEIYHEFGYDQALSRDPASLSYIYELDEKNWLLLLDSCRYENGNEVGGRIREETYEWMEEQVTEAVSRGITVIPTAHHNLMDESKLYTTECTLDDNERLIELLESWKCPVYLSGHLHLQRMQKHETGEDYGIYEIVGSSFSLPPCQYGVLKWNEDGTMTYRAKELDVYSWAVKQGIEDEQLLNFDQYTEEFLMESVGAKVGQKDLQYLPEGQEEAMKRLYVKVYENYCGGIRVNTRQMDEAQNYWMWERNRPESGSREKLDIMIGDADSDNRELTIPIYKYDENEAAG